MVFILAFSQYSNNLLHDTFLSLCKNMRKIIAIYIILIALSGSYALHLYCQKNRQIQQYFHFLETAKKADSALEKYLSQIKQHIEKEHLSYPCGYHDSLFAKATFIPKKLKSIHALAETEISHSFHGTTENNYLPFLGGIFTDHAKLNDYFHQITVLNDSLRYFIEKDSQAIALFDTLRSSELRVSGENILMRGRDDQKALWLAAYGLYQTAKGCQVMAELKNQTVHLSVRLDSVLPIIVLEKNCFYAKDQVKGTVLMASYFSNSQDIQMFVDGKAIPFKDGLGVWKPVYQTAGDRKVTIKILFKNPLTGEIKDFRKDFLLEICE